MGVADSPRPSFIRAQYQGHPTFARTVSRGGNPTILGLCPGKAASDFQARGGDRYRATPGNSRVARNSVPHLAVGHDECLGCIQRVESFFARVRLQDLRDEFRKPIVRCHGEVRWNGDGRRSPARAQPGDGKEPGAPEVHEPANVIFSSRRMIVPKGYLVRI